jgi:predicted regulator of amino acid metabolism with ACT domain
MADIAEIKNKIIETIDNSKKKLKPADVQKKVAADMGCDRKDVKTAIKELVDEETLTYAYLGGSYLIRPPKE